MKKLLLAIAVLSLSNQAMSEKWIYINTDSYGAKFYLDITSIKKSDITLLEDNSPLYSVWEKVKYPPNHADAKKLGMVSTKAQLYYSCQHKLLNIMSLVVYGADGSVKDRIDKNETKLSMNDLKPVMPKTPIAVKLNIICKRMRQ